MSSREHSGHEDMTTSTQKAARAIGWGTAFVCAFLVPGTVLVLLRGDGSDAHTDEWSVVAGALAVALVGTFVIVYGLVQLMRARHEHEREAT